MQAIIPVETKSQSIYGKFNWTLKDYFNIDSTPDAYVESDPFCLNGFEFKMRFYPGGNSCICYGNSKPTPKPSFSLFNLSASSLLVKINLFLTLTAARDPWNFFCGSVSTDGTSKLDAKGTKHDC
jgi:hypothetical protein